ncbi:MAG: hypothetical protein J1E37_04185 [Prevotella sp.]|nr:hypothetical protein [Prevotella sp.]
MDNFFKNWNSKLNRRESPANAQSSSTDSAAESQTSVKSGSFDEKIVYVRNPQVALTVSAVYRAVELRANTIGQMLVQSQKRDVAGEKTCEDKERDSIICCKFSQTG